jgi:hypothetical protein
MCAVSVIYDMFKPMPDSWYNQERIDLFRTMVKAAQFLIKKLGNLIVPILKRKKLKIRLILLKIY